MVASLLGALILSSKGELNERGKDQDYYFDFILYGGIDNFDMDTFELDPEFYEWN